MSILKCNDCAWEGAFDPSNPFEVQFCPYCGGVNFEVVEGIDKPADTYDHWEDLDGMPFPPYPTDMEPDFEELPPPVTGNDSFTL